MTRLNVNDARCEALFASGLQRSGATTAEAAASAIRSAVRQFGARGCAGRMAQEFGDHPEAAAERMRWIREFMAETSARPAPPASRLQPAGNDQPHDASFARCQSASRLSARD